MTATVEQYRDQLIGLFPILVSPFNSDYSLDLRALRSQIDFVSAQDVTNLVLLGTQGEFASMSTDERKLFTETALEHNNGAKLTIVGVSHSDTLTACELARHARSAGADLVMATPPYYTPVTAVEVRDHFTRIIDAAEIPLVLYNAPATGTFNLTPEFVAAIADHPGVVAIKQASTAVPDLSETLAMAGDKVEVIGGSEAMMWPCLTMGMRGCTTTATCALPAPFAQLLEYARKGELQAGAELYRSLSPFRQLCKRFGHAAVVKVALDVRGIGGGPVRPPLRQPSAEDRDRIQAELHRMRLL